MTTSVQRSKWTIPYGSLRVADIVALILAGTAIHFVATGLFWGPLVLSGCVHT